MLRASLLSVLLAACLAFASTATAQVVPVRNTGCPNFAPPQWTGQARLGQTLTFTYLRRPAPRSSVILLLGLPSGRGIDFFPPLTCVAGPCRLYPAPIGGSYLSVVDNFMATLPIAIPNDRRLLFQTFSVQGANFEGLQGCFTLSQAVSFAIGP